MAKEEKKETAKAGRKKAKRMHKTHVVLQVLPNDTFRLVSKEDTLRSTADGRKWLNENGEEGTRYQPATFNGPALIPEVELKRRVVLRPATDPPPI